MKATKPLVSIILPVYKAEKHLSDTLASILSQNYKNIEVLAVVDYLRDNSLKILRSARKRDKRVRIVKNVQTYGLHVTLNRGIRRSKGDFIAFMGPRHYSSVQRIAKQISFLLKNPNIAAVGTQVTILDEKGKIAEKTSFPLAHRDIHKNLISLSSVNPETIMINKKILPHDILKFTNDRYPYLFADLLINIGMYGELANLKYHLSSIKLTKRQNTIFRVDKKISFLKLLLRSTTLYDYKPSIKSVFLPILKQF